ncbi:M48 family metalloprotease [Streptosporangium sp. NPDC002524]|uniref:M48 family metalloprotease n=1 Tax=Streptosporangium sp. NPDC002524 TaxID=3154537 RepID=UPI003333EC0E
MTTAVRSRRVNPFLLPAATTSRFVLLVTIMLAAAGTSADLVAGGPSRWLEPYIACDRAADAAASAGGSADALAVTYMDCLRGVGLDRALVGLCAMALVAVAVGALYFARPRLTIRRQHLVPADPVVHAELYEAVARAGLPGRQPALLLDVNRRSSGGRAFGHVGRRYVRINIGTLHQARRSGDREELDALVAHELAHLRNRDLDLTNLTLATCWVFGGLVALPVLVYTALFQQDRLVDLGLRTLGTAVVIAALTTAVLRLREHYADVRVTTPADDPPGDDPLGGGPLGDDSPGRRPRRLRPLARHPSDQERAEIVRDPGVLMRWMPAETFGAGIAAGLGTCHLFETTRLWLDGVGNWERTALQLAGLVYGVPVAAILVAGAYRAALLALAEGRRPPRGGLAACALAAGVMVGLVAAPSRMSRPWAESAAASPGAALIMAAVLLALCLLFCRWLAATATSWLPVARARTLTPVYLGALGPAALAFGLWLGAWIEMTVMALDTRNVVNGLSALFAEFFDAALLTGLLGALLYPLASWLRYRGDEPARALHLDTDVAAGLPAVRIRPLVALAPAGLVLLASAIVEAVTPLPAVSALIAGAADGTTGTQYDALLMRLAALVGVLVGVTFIAAVVVAVAVGGRAMLGPSHAVLAALSSAAAAIGVLVAPVAVEVCATTPGCGAITPARQVGIVLLVILAIGVPVSLAGAGLVGAAGGVVRMVRRREVSVAPPRPPRHWLRRVAAGVAGVSVAMWLVFAVLSWLGQNGFLDDSSGSPTTSAASKVPPPGPAGARTARAACPAVRTLTVPSMVREDYRLNWAIDFARMAESDRPFLVAVGRAGYPRSRDHHGEIVHLTRAVGQYCVRT